MAVKGAIVVDTEKCKGCSVCIANCPTQTIALSKEKWGGVVFVQIQWCHFDISAPPTGS